MFFGRRSRERRPPLSEIVTDSPPIWQRDAGQPSRCAMVRPRHGGTPYLIEVTSGPGKYTNGAAQITRAHLRARSIYGPRPLFSAQRKINIYPIKVFLKQDFRSKFRRNFELFLIVSLRDYDRNRIKYRNEIK